MRRAVCLLIAIAALTSCKKEETPSGGSGGVSGMAAGTSGTGVSGGPAAGMGAPSAGTGSGGAASGTTPGCSAADASVKGSAAHAAAAEILTMASPCGFSSCHTGTGKAKLTLMGSMDLKTLLVGKPSCEAPAIPMVDGSGGDAALKNSWLWLKLTAPTMPGTLQLMPQAGWPATPGTCGQAAAFGDRMPATGDMLEADRLAKIRNWICAGAPGPQ